MIYVSAVQNLMFGVFLFVWCLCAT